MLYDIHTNLKIGRKYTNVKDTAMKLEICYLKIRTQHTVFFILDTFNMAFFEVMLNLVDITYAEVELSPRFYSHSLYKLNSFFNENNHQLNYRIFLLHPL